MTTRTALLLATTSTLVANNGVTSFVSQQITGKSQVTKSSIFSTTSPSEEDQDNEKVYYDILTEGTGATPMETATLTEEVGWAPNTPAIVAPINGWVPKEDYALWGLPGAIAPTGYFDPIGFAQRGTPLNDAKRLREAEVQHGRVAMMATVGYLAQEALPSPFGITGPANDQLQQVPLPAFALLTIAIASAELYRAKVGWVEPKAEIGSNTLWTLRDTYYPGDIGFDPLGLKPTNDYDFQVMQTKELQNGRLAMLGWAGMCSQELVNHKGIMETFEFYQNYDASYYQY